MSAGLGRRMNELLMSRSSLCRLDVRPNVARANEAVKSRLGRRLSPMATRPRVTDLDAFEGETSVRPPERDALFETISGEPVKPLYTASDLPAEPEEAIGLPGEYPYTRGVYTSMYRGRLWTMRQFAGFGTAQETNERFRYLLDHGQTGLSTAFDMPTLMGYDSDHARSLGEVGREGVAVDSLADMET